MDLIQNASNGRYESQVDLESSCPEFWLEPAGWEPTGSGLDFQVGDRPEKSFFSGGFTRCNRDICLYNQSNGCNTWLCRVDFSEKNGNPLYGGDSDHNEMWNFESKSMIWRSPTWFIDFPIKSRGGPPPPPKISTVSSRKRSETASNRFSSTRRWT